jgi:hypothetical protein
VFGLLDGAAQRDGDGLPDPEFNRRNTNRFDSDREPLRQTNPVHGLADRGQQSGHVAAGSVLNEYSPSDASDDSLKRTIVPHQVEVSFLADPDMWQLRLFEIRCDPE